jgi:hypothetical protein
MPEDWTLHDHRYESLKSYIREIFCVGKWLEAVQDHAEWRTLVFAVLDFQFSLLESELCIFKSEYRTRIA